MTANIGILEANYYLPSTKKTLSQVFEDEEKSTEAFAANVDFEKDIGIEALHVAKNETAADLAIKAAKLTMAKSGIDPKEIDLIIDFTSIPEDYVAPTWSAAGQVQKEIGATRAFATAINTGGCAAYQTTLKVATSLMSANDRYNTALLIAGDKTPEFNHNYFPITVVSDGGSAVILKKNMTKRRILGIEVATVGRLHDMWVIPGIHNRKPEDIGGKYPALAPCLRRHPKVQQRTDPDQPVHVPQGHARRPKAGRQKDGGRLLLRLSHILRLGPESFLRGL